MLGGHLDSWPSATGATDNAIGCAIMMEAARILQAVGAKPRRTIRVALWSGEEEGCSDRSRTSPSTSAWREPEARTGQARCVLEHRRRHRQVRGASIFGPPEAASFSRSSEAVRGVGRVRRVDDASRATGGTDSTSFNQAGLPGIGASQDRSSTAARRTTPISTRTSASCRTT
jgi:hypothetical protein